MSNPDGSPIWYELMTERPEAVRGFYETVMGWRHAPMPGGDYGVFTAPDGAGVAGAMPAPGQSGLWAVYFGVADVDAAAARVTELGGRVHMAPRDVAGAGRIAFVADPQGATFYLMRGESDRDSTAFAPADAGHCSWNELVTSDQDAALGFYAALFGWAKAGAMPMGPLGDYTFIGHRGEMIGAVMNRTDPSAAPFWNFAFTVPDIDRAVQAVAEAGGTLCEGPMELPGDEGDWMIQIADPQGARLMLTGKRPGRAA